MRKVEAPEPAYFLGMALLLSVRLVIQVLLYRFGFQALTADDWARVVLAAIWAREPFLQWCGVWLPFHMYTYGAALRVIWELLWVPRAIGVVLGVVAILLMYRLSSTLFNDHQVGLISALLLATNPVHIWLSSTSLTETVQVTLVLAFLLSFTRYLRNGRYGFGFLSALVLAVANGFRFDAWIISGVFGVYLIGEEVLRVLRDGLGVRLVLPRVVAALIPWGFPVVWMMACYVKTGNPLSSTASAALYKRSWYGEGVDFYAYLRTFFKADPYLTIIFPVALVVCLQQHKESRAVKWSLAMTVIPLSIFILLLGGQVELPANNTRYLALFAFLMYPAVAYLLRLIVVRVAKSELARKALLTVILLTITVTQARAAFQFVNDPVAEGLEAGKRIRALRRERLELSQRPFLVELSYWQYLAIHIGANDVSTLVYDRELDLEHRRTSSMFLSDRDTARGCLAFYNPSYVVVRSPELIEVIERDFAMTSSEKVGDYSFFQVPDTAKGDRKSSSCPLRLEPSSFRRG